jgi:hypothetical protein
LEGKIDAVVAAYKESSALLNDVAIKPMKGYIIAREKGPAPKKEATPAKKDGATPSATPATTTDSKDDEAKKADAPLEVYDEFLPVLNLQHSPDRYQ